MSKLKVLMLGPGEPAVTNSGLGKAADHIANYLSTKTILTIIQPENLESMLVEEKAVEPVKKIFRSNLFSDFKVMSEMVKIDVSNTVSPYWSETLSTATNIQESKSVISENLKEFSADIVEAASKLEFNVIYAHDWITFRAALELKETSGKPLVVHVHSLDYDRNIMKTGSWVFELEREAFLAADQIICVSKYSKQIIEEVYHIPENKVNIVYNGYAKTVFPAEKSPFNEKVVLFVGRLTGQKGPTQFLEIAEKVNALYPKSRFVMAGDGDMYRTLIETGAHSAVANKFHMTGYLQEDELKRLYAMSDVYCMPSVSEPFGLTALEAAGAELPVVLSNNSGASELLDGAILVDYNDISGFATAIVSLLESPTLSKQCIDKNNVSLSTISWEKSGKKIYSLISAL